VTGYVVLLCLLGAAGSLLALAVRVLRRERDACRREALRQAEAAETVRRSVRGQGFSQLQRRGEKPS
jgi:hypothetical protein